MSARGLVSIDVRVELWIVALSQVSIDIIEVVSIDVVEVHAQQYQKQQGNSTAILIRSCKLGTFNPQGNTFLINRKQHKFINQFSSTTVDPDTNLVDPHSLSTVDRRHSSVDRHLPSDIDRHFSPNIDRY
ncbi:hypothetical protein F2Q70_00025850 [Brassica cretica]|uniref:Uncharacterized protein n=1 Tax=Brassica cretica TaxID=69181 RepID=A0A8S9LF46_BRACR|nr:hypothetical protein F2Q70_00025850 [Brassica cretica]